MNNWRLNCQSSKYPCGYLQIPVCPGPGVWAPVLPVWRVRQLPGELHPVHLLHDQDIQAASQTRWRVTRRVLGIVICKTDQNYFTLRQIMIIFCRQSRCGDQRARLRPAGVQLPEPGAGPVEDGDLGDGGDLRPGLPRGHGVGRYTGHRDPVVLLWHRQVRNNSVQCDISSILIMMLRTI